MSMPSTLRSLALAVMLSAVAASCGRTSQGQEAAGRDPELDRKVAELLPQLEEFAHLSARQVPTVRAANSETLEAYLLERIDLEYPGDSLESLARAYKAFGLLPDDVDLRTLLVDLLLEQAIGYYDPARDVLFIRDDAPAMMLDAVIVHELVHALQDQYVDLDSLTLNVPGNDARSAIQSAMEGHGMVAMMAYQLSQMTGTTVAPEDLPELGPEMAAALADPSAFPQLAGAPAIVREPLLFAYLGGARYVQRLWSSQPDYPPPFGEWLPQSTEQILHTRKLLVERDDPTTLAMSQPGSGWRPVYTRDLGELEIRIFFEEHLQDRPTAAAAAAGWDGDAYMLLSDGDATALVWYSVWDSKLDADEFVVAYRRAFAARFDASASGDLLSGLERQSRIDTFTLSGMPAVRIVESPPGVELTDPPQADISG
jgi:hypothetical protein